VRIAAASLAAESYIPNGSSQKQLWYSVIREDNFPNKRLAWNISQ
jgi:hypothetical protein